MTCNILMETVLGKSCLMEGKFGDATPFGKSSVGSIDEMCERLKQHGFEATGTEELYNGMTGEVIPARIFIGPMYYLRLKHLVSQKIHMRAQGQVTALFRQPLEGRSRGGGLRKFTFFYYIFILIFVI